MSSARYFVGIDVGIKNLAICVIDPQLWVKYAGGESDDCGVVVWRNINLLDEPKRCAGVTKAGKICDKLAKFECSGDYYCGMHKTDAGEKYTTPRVKGICSRELKRRLFVELDSIAELTDAKLIAIESQPRVNQQMKMFATAIETYFIIRNLVDKNVGGFQIVSSPAKNKLSMYDGPAISTGHIRDRYACRKFLAEMHTEYFLSKSPGVLESFYTCEKKKNDLADAFLHCILAIRKKY